MQSSNKNRSSQTFQSSYKSRYDIYQLVYYIEVKFFPVQSGRQKAFGLNIGITEIPKTKRSRNVSKIELWKPHQTLVERNRLETIIELPNYYLRLPKKARSLNQPNEVRI